MVPQDDHGLISRTWDHVPSQGKGTADTLMGKDLALAEGVSWVIEAGPGGSQESVRVGTSGHTQSVNNRLLLALKKEKEGHEQRRPVAVRNWKRPGTDARLEPKEGAQVCQHLDLSPVRALADSQLQN